VGKPSAKRENVGVWGQSPQRGPGAEPLGTAVLMSLNASAVLFVLLLCNVVDTHVLHRTYLLLLLLLLLLLYCRFCKNAIFQNFGNIIFFCRFAFSSFSFFFSGQLFSAVSQPIYTKFGMNVSSCMRLKQTRAIFEKFKNQVTTVKKHRKNGHFFIPDVTFSLVVWKRFNIFEKSFRR